MTDDRTARLSLPLLQAGQAQKDMTHNEALALIDIVAQAGVTGVGIDTPPATPAAGACWIVGAVPSGAWAGHAGAIAGWTGGGWRFVAAREGLSAWEIGARRMVTFVDGVWETGTLRGTRLIVDGQQVVGAQQPAIPVPAGGATIDAEARGALMQVVAVLQAHGLIA